MLVNGGATLTIANVTNLMRTVCAIPVLPVPAFAEVEHVEQVADGRLVHRHIRI
jgi:hypothetical protein